MLGSFHPNNGESSGKEDGTLDGSRIIWRFMGKLGVPFGDPSNKGGSIYWGLRVGVALGNPMHPT